MTTYVGLLRAVNVGGRTAVRMADLRHVLDELGLHDVRTLLQSGNVVFRSDVRGRAQLETMLEQATAARLGLTTDYFVRTAAEHERIVAANPFPEEAERDPGHLLVMFLKKTPARGDVTALQKAITGRELVRAGDRHLYVTYPDGIGRSRLTGALIERMLGTGGTGRNWNTLVKLGALAAAPAP